MVASDHKLKRWRERLKPLAGHVAEDPDPFLAAQEEVLPPVQVEVDRLDGVAADPAVDPESGRVPEPLAVNVEKQPVRAGAPVLSWLLVRDVEIGELVSVRIYERRLPPAAELVAYAPLLGVLGEGAVRVLQPELLAIRPDAAVVAAGRAVEVEMPVQVDVRGRAPVAVATAGMHREGVVGDVGELTSGVDHESGE